MPGSLVNRLRNEKGIVLGVVLILSAVGLALMAALMLMASRWTGISKMERNYRTAIDAARGGAEIAYQVIGARGAIDGLGLTTDTEVRLTVDNQANLTTKMTQATALWGGLDRSSNIDPAVAGSYDMRCAMGDYTVYVKVVDTVEGNSGNDLGLRKDAVVPNDSEIKVVNIPYLYTLEVLSERTNAGSPNAPTERSRLQILYEY